MRFERINLTECKKGIINMDNSDESEISSKKGIIKIKKIPFKNVKCITIAKELVYWLFIFVLIKFYDYYSMYLEISLESRKISRILLILLALIFDIIWHFIKKDKVQMHKKFIALALIFGMVYLIISPFGSGNDEVSHFLRVYEISEKYVTFEKKERNDFSIVFQNLEDYKKEDNITYKKYSEEFHKFELDNSEKMDLTHLYWNIKLYSPLQYLPQVIGVTIGRVISNNILVIGMFGRIAGFAFWLVLCAYSIKIVPNKKTFFTILCLLPINLYSAVCLSGDTVTNAICVFFIAMIYKKVYNEEKITKKEKIMLIISACMIALCKIVYLPIIFLVLLLKPQNFDNKKSFIKFVCILIILSSIVGLGWLKLGSRILGAVNTLSKNQVEFILENPIRYCLIMIETMQEKGTDYIYQLVTGNELLSNGKTVVFPILSYIISIILLMSLFIVDDEKNVKVDFLRKLMVWGIIVGIIVLIITAIYVQWTSLFEIGRRIVAGIQGRYFIPVVAICIFIIDSINLKMKKENLVYILSILQFPILFLIMNTFMR